ncbi:MAG: glucokinase [Burkholderiales bacterium]|nr:glucokinase [Burkholderiales bacterium]
MTIAAKAEGPALVLAADIGGTHAVFRFSELRPDGRHETVIEKSYASRDFENFDSLMNRLFSSSDTLAARPRLVATCLAVAGPVKHNTATLTNLGWTVNAAELAEKYALKSLRLINDFHAAGHGVMTLDDSKLFALQAAEPDSDGTIAVIGAGTGLGVAILEREGEGYRVLPSEAGNADFAPIDELQDQLMIHLRRTYGRVSWERVISGPGLMRIFSFLQDAGYGIPSKQLQEATRRSIIDYADVIADFGLHKQDQLATRALDLFISAYGSFAGNIALTALARGGVYIAGGIAPKIVNRLKDGGFMRAFSTKGAFAPLLSGIPVRVVMDAQVGLRGALRVAGQGAV